MLEYEWLHGTDYEGMISVIGKAPDSRKLGLAACAYIRWNQTALRDARIRAAVETAERYADFGATKEQLKDAKRSLAALVEEIRAQRLQDKATVPERAWSDPEHEGWWGLSGVDWEL